MAQGNRPGEKPDPAVVYADIIDHPRWEPSSKHPRMSLYKRAAQFMPFAALSGYSQMVEDKFRVTEPKMELSEYQQEQLNSKLSRISRILSAGGTPEVVITYFVPDPRKEGGKYEQITAQVRKIDSFRQKIFLCMQDDSNIPETISFDSILTIQGEAAEDPDDF